MRILDIPKSGRCGKFVFYMRGRRLCRRLYVVPRNVRTAARRRARGDFGAISKAWSQLLTERQRRAWIIAAAEVQSHPRLWQSGPLTGEMYFQGLNSARARIGRKLLLWPPQRVVFGPNPVKAATISYVNGQMRLRLKVAGPVTEDIMVFGQAPCSAGRKKWRHGAYLCLLPAPKGGVSDITDPYVRKYGQPEPGQRIFIRTRQQQYGWESYDKDLSALVPVKPLVAVFPRPRPSRSRIPLASPATRARCPMHKGVVPKQYRSSSQVIPMQRRRSPGSPRGVPPVGPGSRRHPLPKLRR